MEELLATTTKIKKETAHDILLIAESPLGVLIKDDLKYITSQIICYLHKTYQYYVTNCSKILHKLETNYNYPNNRKCDKHTQARL
jgi:hypothetical protein